MTTPVQTDPRHVARLAGLALLLICASALLSTDLIVAGDTLATANNLRMHERSFRIGILGEFVMLSSDIVLAVALYLLLSPVNRVLALLGSAGRLANAGLICVGLVASMVALHLATKADGTVPQSLQAAWMHMWLDAQGTAETFGLIFFGLGAALHSYLLYRARLIPRLLSGAYLIATKRHGRRDPAAAVA